VGLCVILLRGRPAPESVAESFPVASSVRQA